jgi:hypothetical protein
MSTPSAPAVLRSLLFRNADASLPKVAYNADETIRAFGVAPSTVWRLIRSGELPTRNTGKSYLVSGGVIIDVLGREPKGVNDPRRVIDPEQQYLMKQFAALLGVPYRIAHRLTQGADAKVTPERLNSRLFLPGRVILDYLAGHDEPIRYQPAHRASA